jgi:hypothetical protein
VISKIKLIVALTTTGWLVTGGHAAANDLDGNFIKGLFPGYYEAKIQGTPVIVAGYGNGWLSGATRFAQDRGRWFVQNDQLCVSWEKWTVGKPVCGTISQVGGWFVATGEAGEVLKFRRTAIAKQ